MRNWPLESVVTERVFSVSAGLEASTVTPGSTAPEASFTVPAMDAWAYTTEGRNSPKASNPTTRFNARIFAPLIRCRKMRLPTRSRRQAGPSRHWILDSDS